MSKSLFVRAREDEDTIQIGIVDPNLPYAQRPVEIVLVSNKDALLLAAEICQQFARERSTKSP